MKSPDPIMLPATICVAGTSPILPTLLVVAAALSMSAIIGPPSAPDDEDAIDTVLDLYAVGACPDLRIVVRYGVGVDNVDLNEAAKRHIHVANIPDYGAEIEVSEHALALYLAVQRRIAERDQDIREGRWGIGQAAPIPARDRSVLGLNGCGKIGLATAQKFRALGFPRVIAFDPFLDPDQARQAQVERVDLDTLCAHADVVSLHTPLTPETHHILSAARIVADYDGVVCVPREYAEAVLEMAREIDDREVEQAKLIIESGSLKEGLAKYGRI